MEQAAWYVIRVRGALGPARSAWFEELVLNVEDNGETVISGCLDQAALHGVLVKIRNLGLPLLSVVQAVGTDRNDR
jgi:hypothetical protein